MMRADDTRARNKRIAVILIATAAFLCLGSMAYIDWFHSVGPGAAAAGQK